MRSALERSVLVLFALCSGFIFAQNTETESEEAPSFRSQWDFWLREEPGFSLRRKDSLLNPDDFLGLPRLQNRVLASVDAKIPIIGGVGINPIAELVIANTFVYLQHEGNSPTLAKPQISDYRNFLKEFYFNLRPTQNLLVTLGRRNLIEGVGYSRNPVDFMANPSTLPGANFDNRFRLRNREGSFIARAEYFWRGGALSYMYAPYFTPSNAENEKLRTEIDRLAQFNRQQAHWLKIYQLVYGYDISLHYFYRERHNIGFAATKVFGDALELHAEGRVTRGSAVLTPYKRNDDIFFGTMLMQPALYDFAARSQESYFARVLFGGQYTFENKLNLSLEYYYNGEGYTNAQLDTLYDGLELAGSRYTNNAYLLPIGNPYRLFLLSANLNFNFLSMGQHYAFMRLFDPEFLGSNKWEAAVFAMALVTDGSTLAAVDFTHRLSERFDLQFLVNGFFGSRRSEAGLFYQGMSALIAIEAQF